MSVSVCVGERESMHENVILALNCTRVEMLIPDPVKHKRSMTNETVQVLLSSSSVQSRRRAPNLVT